MKFNPITRELFTSDGVFIKKLHCERGIEWRLLHESALRNGRACPKCSRLVIDTGTLTDEQAQLLVRHDRSVCFKVSLDQSNMEMAENALINKVRI